MPSIIRGTCYCIFVYDIAFLIDPNEAERRISSAKRETIKHKRRAPKYFEYRPAPLGISQAAESVRIATVHTSLKSCEPKPGNYPRTKRWTPSRIEFHSAKMMWSSWIGTRARNA